MTEPAPVCPIPGQRTVCKHCGLALPEQASEFCCSGCKAVYEILHEYGLQNFYRLRERGGAWSTKPVSASHRKFDYLDGTDAHAEFVGEEGGGILRARVFLEGLHCSACVWLLEQLPKIHPGLLELRVNFVRGSAEIVFDSKVTKLSAIAARLSSLGYTPYPIGVNGAEKNVPRADRRLLTQLGVAGFCASNTMLLAIGRYQGLFTGMDSDINSLFAWISMLLSLPVIFFSALPFFRAAWSGLKLGRLHIDLPLSIAIIGGFVPSAFNTIRGAGEIYFDTITALVFLLLAGRWMQRRSLGAALDRSAMLSALAPRTAQRIRGGAVQEVLIEALQPGDIVRLTDGDIVPADGLVHKGTALIDPSLLTGESMPITLGERARVFAGTRSVGSQFELLVERQFAQSRIAEIVNLVHSAAQSKAPIVQLTDKIGAWFVAAVLVLSVVTFVVWLPAGGFTALDRVIALLVVTCPCAVGIATPITLSLAFARAAASGILIKSQDAIDLACQVKSIYLDKTGTLTRGQMHLRAYRVAPAMVSDLALLRSAVQGLEAGSHHPVAAALALGFAGDIEALALRNRTEEAGRGVTAVDQSGTRWTLGSEAFSRTSGVAERGLFSEAELTGQEALTVVSLVRNEKLAAQFLVGDVIRDESPEVVAKLRRMGMELFLVSGDSVLPTRLVGRQLKFPETHVFAEVSPEEKSLLVSRATAQQTTAMVGDGINDAVALKSASLGIGLRGGAEACLRVADVFLAKADLTSLLDFFEGSRRTLGIVRRGLLISIFYNGAGAALAVAGLVGPLVAALVMPISSLTVISLAIMSKSFNVAPLRSNKV
ncbi:MAG: heavy metal translocating P-type ATPase [Oligoflexia bacterium]|nr:heavy metal translocating P-type ATPase [Oligoflexia bacterium]